MTRRIRSTIVFTAIFIFSLGVVLFRASSNYSNVAAHYTFTKSDTGIPGLATWYEAHLVNHGVFPVRIQVCDFVDDTSSRGTMLAYSVQRFDQKKGSWQTIADASDVRSCHPYPLGWIEAQLKMIWLLPHHELSTGEEITGARGFRKGDLARFLVYSAYHEPKRNGSIAFASPAFTIDEEIGDDPSKFRVKH
jgi:hypothetical protein